VGEVGFVGGAGFFGGRRCGGEIGVGFDDLVTALYMRGAAVGGSLALNWWSGVLVLSLSCCTSVSFIAVSFAMVVAWVLTVATGPSVHPVVRTQGLR
jgi:hypothetical protein